MTDNKTKLVSDFHANIDLSMYSPEVRKYIADNLPLRVYRSKMKVELDQESDGTFTVLMPILVIIDDLRKEAIEDVGSTRERYNEHVSNTRKQNRSTAEQDFDYVVHGEPYDDDECEEEDEDE